MAQSKEEGRGGSSPDKIQQRKRQWSGELGGPRWTEIQKWHAQGLGRAIGTDIYALRHTTGSENWWDDRVLLLFPNSKTTDLCLVGPRISQSTVFEEACMENEGNWSDFIAQFSPSQHPYQHPSWQPADGITAFDSFLKNASTFSVFVHNRSFSSEERRNVIDEALINARALHEPQRVRRLDVSSSRLMDTMDPDDFRFLVGLVKQFDTQVDLRERDDSVTPYEGRHLFEEGK